MRIICLVLYYLFARKLPRSTTPFFGRVSRKVRYFCVKRIFKYCGRDVNIERNAYFGSGANLEIGDFSGIGYHCEVPANIKIGSYVMMAPEVFIPTNNHAFADRLTPMCFQGVKESARTIIEDDVWIGRRAVINPGRYIKKGSIIAAGTVLVKDYPEYSIVGGNPSILIKNRNV
ncbi:acyltransferase [Cycloclasticus pugetii]|uniref:acyltransferase n=1 Tax=Cycloclasticus pugetii TaxID=34068 RepID=UPI003A9598F1